MHHVIPLLLRRMRWPLITLVAVYAVSILGLVLIPGADAQGEPWRMDFFHAFYFVSFMGSTIGFGEIPHPFTDAQRMWTTFAIYATVVAWLYAIGTLLSVIQDPAFRRVLDHAGFSRSVRRLTEPFYILCGYGDTGRLLVHELAERGIQATVIDPDEARIQDLAVEPLPIYVPGLCADASDSETLVAAGLRHPRCKGVLAVSARDAVNLKVAITTRLLTPWLQVICRAETRDAAANMASFGTDHIVNAFDTFGERLAMMFRSPSMYLVFEWITAVYGAPLEEFRAPPRGRWVSASATLSRAERCGNRA
jgi:Trk K+ transport system NAD-binding subunit